MKVKEVMHKGVDWRAPDTPLIEIAQLMRDEDIGAVPIGENDRLVGMVTDRDIVCRAVAEEADLAMATARDVMTKGIIYCREDEDIEDVIHLMEDRQVRRLPVISKEKRLIGILTMGDLSHAVSHELAGELTRSVAGHHAPAA